MIKFAVIGCGHIGKRHIQVIKQATNAKLVAICDIDRLIAKRLSENNGNVPHYLDYKEMLDKESIDVVNIATPHGLHAEMSIYASQAKRHVLIEKPMALKVEDANQMIEAAKKNDKKLFIVKQNRYNKPIAITKKALDEGKLGKIYLVQCNVFWNRVNEYYTQSNWRGKKDMEGGALQTQGSHFIDLLLWFFGDIESAKTTLGTLKHNIEIEDCGVSVLKFTSGAMGSINWTTCVYNKNYEGSITIIGEKGTIKIGGTYLNKIDFWDVQGYPMPDVSFDDQPNKYGIYSGSSSNHNQLINELVAQLMENRDGVVEGEEGYKTVQTIEHIYSGV